MVPETNNCANIGYKGALAKSPVWEAIKPGALDLISSEKVLKLQQHITGNLH
jgi:hypothetical protein